MKKIFFLICLVSLLAHKVSAQENNAENVETTEKATETTEAIPVSKSISNWGIGLSALQWNETLNIQQGITTEKDIANFNALILSVQKERTYYHWGWNMNGFIGSGRAVGGGNASLVPYQKDRVAFTLFGISPRAFYRLSGRINFGITAMAFTKNIDWPKDNANQTIDSGRKLNLMAMADLNIRILQRWDFYSGIGPITDAGTLWKV
ncbi:MAG: hypothetical protein ACXVCP_12260, partial [Bdellovibrio sp.]